MALNNYDEVEEALANMPIPIIRYILAHSHIVPFILLNRGEVFGKPCVGTFEVMEVDEEKNWIIIDKPIETRGRIEMPLTKFYDLVDVILDTHFILN